MNIAEKIQKTSDNIWEAMQNALEEVTDAYNDGEIESFEKKLLEQEMLETIFDEDEWGETEDDSDGADDEWLDDDEVIDTATGDRFK